MNSGIYEIKNLINGKIYIGSSSNLKKRMYSHIYNLRNNRHRNSFLQNSWNKYGESNFHFSVVEFVGDISNLLTREQYWIDTTMCYIRSNGFNIRKIAESNYGIKLSEESKKRMSESRKGKGSPWFGKRLSTEHRKKLSDSKKGKETWNKGKKLSLEHIEALKTSHLGNKLTKTQKLKIKESNIGKHLGSKNSQSSIDEKTVILIKNMILEGYTNSEIQDKLSLSRGVVSGIKSGSTWSHVKIPEEKAVDIRSIDNRKAKDQRYNAKLMESQVKEIKSLLKKNMTGREIARLFNISVSTISAIKNKKIWSEI